MTRTPIGVRTLRDQLERAARDLHPAEPTRILLSAHVPLARQRDPLGVLGVTLRLTFRADEEARGRLSFHWPAAAADHSAMRSLVRLESGHGDGWSVERCRTESGGSERVDVDFSASSVPEVLDPLLELLDRIGMGRALVDRLRAAAPAAPSAPEPAAVPLPRVDLDAADLAKVDAIHHNEAYDPQRHPHVLVNQEVANGTGEAFRLVQKRVGGQPRRVWVRVARAAAAH